MGTRARLLCLPGGLLQQTRCRAELRVEVTAQNLQDLNQRPIADGIIDLVPHFPADDDLFGPQHGQMLRRIGLLDAEFFDQLSGRQLSVSQKFNDRDPRRIGKPLKDLTFELPERVIHIYSIFESSHMGPAKATVKPRIKAFPLTKIAEFAKFA